MGTLMSIIFLMNVALSGSQVLTSLLNQASIGTADAIIKQLLKKAQKDGVNLSNQQEALSWLQSAEKSSPDTGYTIRKIREMLDTARITKNDLQAKYDAVTAQVSEVESLRSQQAMAPDPISSIKIKDKILKKGVESGVFVQDYDEGAIYDEFRRIVAKPKIVEFDKARREEKAAKSKGDNGGGGARSRGPEPQPTNWGRPKAFLPDTIVTNYNPDVR